MWRAGLHSGTSDLLPFLPCQGLQKFLLWKWKLSLLRLDIIVVVIHTLAIVGESLVSKMFGMSIMKILLS